MPSQPICLTTIMQRYKGAWAAVFEERGEAHRTFEIVNSFAIQNSNPVLEPRFTTTEKIHDISCFLRRF